MKLTRTTNVYVFNKKGQVVMLFHKKANKWLPPGGHIEENELTHEAARREVKEETGLEIEFIYHSLFQETLIEIDNRCSMLPQPFFAQLEHDKDYYLEDFIYVAKTSQYEIDNKEKHEIGWFSIDDALKLDTFPNVKKHLEYLREYYGDRLFS